MRPRVPWNAPPEASPSSPPGSQRPNSKAAPRRANDPVHVPAHAEVSSCHEEPHIAWPVTCDVWFGLLAKQFRKKQLRPLEPVFAEHDRLRAAARVTDVAL